jgi:hypothetical protein
MGTIQDAPAYSYTSQTFGPAGGGNGLYSGYNGVPYIQGKTGLANTGGGGAGGVGYSSVSERGAGGGSGIVVIRYPSYQAPATSCVGGEMYVVNGWRVYKFVASGTITF